MATPIFVRAVVEGLALAARDCYEAMGELPSELRLSGGAARSQGLRRDSGGCGACASTCVSCREETGAAGAAMMAAVAIGAYPNMDACIAEWVTPLHRASGGRLIRNSCNVYDRLFPVYLASRRGLVAAWDVLASTRRETSQRG